MFQPSISLFCLCCVALCESKTFSRHSSGTPLPACFCNFTLCCADDLLDEYTASPQLKGMSMPEVQLHMSHLRHLTFKRLAEQHPTTEAPKRKAAAAGLVAAVDGASSGSRPAAGVVGSSHLPGSAGGVELSTALGGGWGNALNSSSSPQGDTRNPFSDQQGMGFNHLPL